MLFKSLNSKTITAETTTATAAEIWVMGFFLIFFPEEEEDPKKKHIFSSLSPSCKPSISTTFNTFLRRTNSVHLVSKAQSTISICALLVFFSLLFFTLSTFEPTTAAASTFPRRQLSSIKLYNPKSSYYRNLQHKPSITHAFQGMGTVYTRGTKAMNDLIICHVMDSVSVNDLRLFLKLVHRSSLTSRSDLLFIFPSGSSGIYEFAIRQENELFLQLITRFRKGELDASFDVTPFVKSIKENAEPIWGRRIRSSNYSRENETELTELSYGSVVGFEVDELDPENSLAGFMDHVPLSLRRWACYTLLLGRLRRNFKHVMLVDAKDVMLHGDPLGRVKNRSPESVYLSTTTALAKHGRKNSDKNHVKDVITPSIISGGARGIRRLSNSMLADIVRVAMQHKRKNSVTDSMVLNQLMANDWLVSNIKVVVLTESIPEASSLSSAALLNHSVIRRGNSNIEDLGVAFMKHICLFKLDLSVYSSDC